MVPESDRMITAVLYGSFQARILSGVRNFVDAFNIMYFFTESAKTLTRSPELVSYPGRPQHR